MWAPLSLHFKTNRVTPLFRAMQALCTHYVYTHKFSSTRRLKYTVCFTIYEQKKPSHGRRREYYRIPCYMAAVVVLLLELLVYETRTTLRK